MLRKRSRQVSINQRLSDHFQTKITKLTPSSSMIFHSLFTNLNFEANPMNLMMMSSELEQSNSNNNNKPFSSSSPFADPKNRAIGLALIDSLIIDKNPTDSDPKRLVHFGSQLKIKVPTSPIQLPSSPNSSPCEFGIKTPRSNFSRFGKMGNEIEFMGSTGSMISMEEMELSEDYTCVISHGPNPKRTHIFGNCVVVDDGGEAVRSPAAKRVKDVRSWSENESGSEGENESEGFLKFCYQCNLELGHGKDIFMYRGEKAFCSQECRYQEMMFDAVDNN